MTGFSFRFLVVLLVLLLLLDATRAAACIAQRNQRIADVLAADIALIGRVTDYKETMAGEHVNGAILTVELIFPLKGTLASERKFLWLNSTFPYSNKWQGNGLVFIAALDGNMRAPKRMSKFVDRESDIPIILQAHCTTPFVFAAPSPRASVASALVLVIPIMNAMALCLLVLMYLKHVRRSRVWHRPTLG